MKRLLVLVLGVAGTLVLVPFAAWVVREPRAGEGPAAAPEDVTDDPEVAPQTGMALSAALRTRSFWILAVALLLVTYIPTISLGPVRALHGESFYVPFPTGEQSSGSAADPKQGGGALTIQEMMRMQGLSDEEGEAGAEEGGAERPAPAKRPLTIQEMMRMQEALDGAEGGEASTEQGGEG